MSTVMLTAMQRDALHDALWSHLHSEYGAEAEDFLEQPPSLPDRMAASLSLLRRLASDLSKIVRVLEQGDYGDRLEVDTIDRWLIDTLRGEERNCRAMVDEDETATSPRTGSLKIWQTRNGGERKRSRRRPRMPESQSAHFTGRAIASASRLAWEASLPSRNGAYQSCHHHLAQLPRPRLAALSKPAPQSQTRSSKILSRAKPRAMAPLERAPLREHRSDAIPSAPSQRTVTSGVRTRPPGSSSAGRATRPPGRQREHPGSPHVSGGAHPA
jgi:hypothetical protein